MKNKMQLGVCSALLIGSLVGGLGTEDLAASASSNDEINKVAQQVVGQFKDVSKNHYAYEAIEWAKAKGIVSGYTDSKGNPNGLFGPNDDVTEAQFVKMVAEYFGLKDDSGDITKKGASASKTHWSDTNYDALAKYGVPLNGYFDNTVRNKAVKRGTVAQVLGYLMGDTSSLSGSINFLINNGVTTGQNPEFEGKDLNKFFGSTNNLTRGQVVAFLHRIDTKALNKLGQGSSAYAEINQDLNSKANFGSGMLDTILSGTNNSSTSTTSTNGRLVVITPGGLVNHLTGANSNNGQSGLEHGNPYPPTITTEEYLATILGYLSNNTKNYISSKGYKWEYAGANGAELLTTKAASGDYHTLNIFNKSSQTKIITTTSDYELMSRVFNDYFGVSISASNLKSKIDSIRKNSANKEALLVGNVYCNIGNNGMSFYKK